MIISAFAGVGKTTLSKNRPDEFIVKKTGVV